MQIWGVRTPYPEPINIKFGMDDYVGDIIPHANIYSNRQSGRVPLACMKYHSRVVF